MLIKVVGPVIFILDLMESVLLPAGTEFLLLSPGTDDPLESIDQHHGRRLRARLRLKVGGSIRFGNRILKDGQLGFLPREEIFNWQRILRGEHRVITDLLGVDRRYCPALLAVAQKIEQCQFLAADDYSRFSLLKELLGFANIGGTAKLDAFRGTIEQMNSAIKRKSGYLISARSLVLNRSLFIPYRLVPGYDEDTSVQCLDFGKSTEAIYNRTILDVGCGLSFFAAEATVLFNAKCVCLDLSAKAEAKRSLLGPYTRAIMLLKLLIETGGYSAVHTRQASKELRELALGLFENLELVCSTYCNMPIKTGDIFSLGYKDSSFEHVICVWVIPYFGTKKEQLAAVAELLRVARFRVTIKCEEVPLLSGGKGTLFLEQDLKGILKLKEKEKGVTRVSVSRAGLLCSVWKFDIVRKG